MYFSYNELSALWPECHSAPLQTYMERHTITCFTITTVVFSGVKFGCVSTAVLKCDRDLLTLSLLIQLHKHVSSLTSVEASGKCGVAIHFASSLDGLWRDSETAGEAHRLRTTA